MRVAVTGATGYVGRFVVAGLMEEGHAVRVLARAGADRGGFTAEPEWITGDLRDAAAVAALVRGVDAVVHAAYEHVPGRYRGGEGNDLAGFLDANLLGSLALMQAARAAGAGRFVLLSSRAVYGRRLPGRPLDEDHPTAPDSHYGALKAALEAFTASFAADGWNACALRPTGVYGRTWPLRRSKWHPLISAMLAGQPWPHPRAGTEVHGQDVARAVGLLLRADGVAGRTFNCSDLAVSDRDVARIVQETVGGTGPLPEGRIVEAEGIMDCAALKALGMRFGGRPLLEATVAELMHAIRHGA